MVTKDSIKRVLDEHFTCSQQDWLTNFDQYFNIDNNGYVNGIAKNPRSFTLQAKKLPNGIPVKFGTFKGSFYISNSGLTNLNGCPREIKGHFYCSNNKLESLADAPKIVSDRCTMIGSNLTTGVGLPQQCQSYYLAHNSLESLEGIESQKANLLIDLSHNQIKTLDFCPESTTTLDVSNNPINSLQGIGEKIKHLTISWPCPIRDLAKLVYTEIPDFISQIPDKPGLTFYPEPSNADLNRIETLRQLLEKYRNQPLGIVDLTIALRRMGVR